MKLAFIFSIFIAMIISVLSRSLRGDGAKAPQVNGGYGRNKSKKVQKFKKLKDKAKKEKTKQTAVLR